MPRPTSMHIDIDALLHNFNCVQKLAPNSKIISMVKANAYGHGLKRIAKALSMTHAFGVACLEEAKIIRKNGLQNSIVLMAGFFTREDLKEASSISCECVIHELWQIDALCQCDLKNPIKIWMKINTGMNRLGFMPQEVNDFYSRLKNCKNVNGLPRLMTHFADADSPNKSTTKSQINIFNQVTRDLSGEKSLANSAGILVFPKAHADWIRPGIILYGVSPFNDRTGADHNLKPVMTLTSQIISIRKQRKGDAIGYGGVMRCEEDMPIGIVAIGYGDGYPYYAVGGLPTRVNDKVCPLIGRVAMDMLAIDLRACPNAKIGDTVLLLGKDLPVEYIAKQLNTIPYELLCRLKEERG